MDRKVTESGVVEGSVKEERSVKRVEEFKKR
jgi:hypothetical protein